MKTIMIAAAVSLMLAPAAFAAAPTATPAGSKAVATSQATKDGAVLLAAGPSRTGTISIPRGKGFMPGKGFAG
ncbi:hypothetical protein J1C56_06555 [Aminobacter anthyllidis]|uniref:Uncharacterized protein n=1 Tax=Aminobacter anthyllidis TaxID=1035067 RepID=A0A9X1D2K5_9HYPH|nr:hypothetical protein [Aminobacter anthyllidis]MBT1155250.1 hypothetical protein [Aminobacter anthyllidis]MDH4985721.1 hypothetical protein [Aminobacter anthyllidis]